MIKVRDEKYLKALGANIRRYRKEARMSQEELSNSSKVSLPQITRIEHGAVNVTASTVFALAKAMNIHPRRLYDFDVD